MDDKKRKILIVALLALLVLLIVAIVVCVIVINVKNDVEDNKIVPDYPPQETDPNQSPMDNDPGGTLEIEEGGGGVNVTYIANATVYLSENRVELYYANPSKSTQDMVIALVLESGETVICRSQRITPGNQIRELTLDESVKPMLEEAGEGSYNAKFVVGCYDPNTNEKAIVELVSNDILVNVVK